MIFLVKENRCWQIVECVRIHKSLAEEFIKNINPAVIQDSPKRHLYFIKDDDDPKWDGISIFKNPNTAHEKKILTSKPEGIRIGFTESGDLYAWDSRAWHDLVSDILKLEFDFRFTVDKNSRYADGVRIGFPEQFKKYMKSDKTLIKGIENLKASDLGIKGFNIDGTKIDF